MPENTSARDPLLHLLGAMSGDGMSGYITGMEADGQRQLVNSTSLPTDTGSTYDREYEALGFTFGEPDPNDKMFRDATLPEGWSKQGSDHDMWSYIVDQLGRRRVAIFYKAAFYDRKAFMRLETVYSYASTLAYQGGVPVYDDQWCTREAFAEQVAGLRKRITDDIERYEASTAAWAAEELVTLRKDLAKHDAWATRVGITTEGEPSK